MKLMDSSEDKVKKICDTLVKETLEPALKEKEALLEAAKDQAEAIIQNAKSKAKKMAEEAQKKRDEEQAVFESSLKVAAQKGLTHLRDTIETKLFHPEMDQQIAKALGNSDVIVKLIDAIVKGLQDEGMKSELEVIISKNFKPAEIAAGLAKSTVDQLKGKTVETGIEGVMVKCEAAHFGVDITQQAIKEIVLRYAQENLRSILFNVEA